MIKDNSGVHYLAVYGGRNDKMFASTQNIGLNDINIFNTFTCTWTALAFYGIQPCSRWAHVMIPSRTDSPNGFIIYGGVNLGNYCKMSTLHQFQIVNFENEFKIKPTSIFKNKRESSGTEMTGNSKLKWT